MRFRQLLINIAVTLLIIGTIFLLIDLVKTVAVTAGYRNNQSSSQRISSSSNASEIRYAPETVVITNKEDALTEIKKITLSLKDEYEKSQNKERLFEIANIHKIKNLFYNYEKYAIVKYKLLNIIEDLPKLKKATNGYSAEQLKNYFDQNSEYIEEYYGIIDNSNFAKLIKSLEFLGSSNIAFATLNSSTIRFDQNNDVLNFKIELGVENGNSKFYIVNSNYYKSSDNQIFPYVTFTAVE